MKNPFLPICSLFNKVAKNQASMYKLATNKDITKNASFKEFVFNMIHWK